MRDSTSNNDAFANKKRKTNLTGSKNSNPNNEIIPERRRKYLNPGDELSAGNQNFPE